MNKYIIAILLTLISCVEGVDTGFVIMRCPRDSKDCYTGGATFPNLKECEEAVRKIGSFQPNVLRMCIKASYF